MNVRICTMVGIVMMLGVASTAQLIDPEIELVGLTPPAPEVVTIVECRLLKSQVRLQHLSFVYGSRGKTVKTDAWAEGTLQVTNTSGRTIRLAHVQFEKQSIYLRNMDSMSSATFKIMGRKKTFRGTSRDGEFEAKRDAQERVRKADLKILLGRVRVGVQFFGEEKIFKLKKNVNETVWSGYLSAKVKGKRPHSSRKIDKLVREHKAQMIDVRQSAWDAKAREVRAERQREQKKQKKKTQQKTNIFDAGAYRRRCEAQGASSHSIKAMIEIQRRDGKAIIGDFDGTPLGVSKAFLQNHKGIRSFKYLNRYKQDGFLSKGTPSNSQSDYIFYFQFEFVTISGLIRQNDGWVSVAPKGSGFRVVYHDIDGTWNPLYGRVGGCGRVEGSCGDGRGG